MERRHRCPLDQSARQKLDELIARPPISEGLREEFQRLPKELRAVGEGLRAEIHAVIALMAKVQATLDGEIIPLLMKHERRITALEIGRGPAPVKRQR